MFKKLKNWFYNFFKKSDFTIFYILTTTEDENKFLTITSKKEECLEYFRYYLVYLNRVHFKMWCEVRNYSVEEASSVEEYFSSCITEKEKQNFLIKTIRYKKDDLSAILRMFGGVTPLGCSYDTEVEHTYLQSKLDAHKTAEELVKNLRAKTNKENLDEILLEEFDKEYED